MKFKKLTPAQIAYEHAAAILRHAREKRANAETHLSICATQERNASEQYKAALAELLSEKGDK